jgi:predicted dehydrogenase
MGNRVNIALVGAGYWGQKLLPRFLVARQALVRVVCDIHDANRAEIQRRFPQVPTTEFFETVLADQQLDAVVIVTPLATHFSIAKKALATRKHVWV